MSRTEFQPGPAQDHYHDTLGSAETDTGDGSIAATDKQVVYMDGADAVGSPSLTWENGGFNATLGLGFGANDHAIITGVGLGTEVTLQAADGDADHVGGELTLKAGRSDGQSGGQLTIQAGNDGSGGDGGPVVIYSGSAADGESGDIDIKVGGTGNSAEGGRVLIQAGVGLEGSGGDVLVQAGAKVTGGSHGSVRLLSGSGSDVQLNDEEIVMVAPLITVQHPEPPSESANLFELTARWEGEVETARLAVFEVATDGDSDWYLDEDAGAGMRWSKRDGDGVITQLLDFTHEMAHFRYQRVFMTALPTADPGSIGQLYTDGVPSPGVPKTLKVSGG